jgi:hypothetical protein
MINQEVQLSIQESRMNLGRPAHYPVPEQRPEQLFYIQRNKNTATVIYKINEMLGGVLNLDNPLELWWLTFDNNGTENDCHELNAMQVNLAYGYESHPIQNNLIRFCLKAYRDLVFYLIKNASGYRVEVELKNKFCVLDSIFVFTEDLGVFPQVKFADLHLLRSEDEGIFVHRIYFNQ